MESCQHPTSFSHWRPLSCSCSSRICPNPRLNQRSAAASLPQLLWQPCSGVSRYLWERCHCPCQRKLRSQLFICPSPVLPGRLPPARSAARGHRGLAEQDGWAVWCKAASPGASHSCQCNELTGRDRQHPSITPLRAWNAAISLVERAAKPTGCVGLSRRQMSSLTELLLRGSPAVICVYPKQMPPILPPGVRWTNARAGETKNNCAVIGADAF